MCDEDSVYLSDVVMKFLSRPQSQDITAMFRDKCLEAYARSEKRPDLIDFLEGKGLIWNFGKPGHGRQFVAISRHDSRKTHQRSRKLTV
jgi:hypothetical protein